MYSHELTKGFSIIIPTWNNVDYLMLCLDRLVKYSNLQHEIIIHVNEGCDQTIEEIQKFSLLCPLDIKMTSSNTNIGICSAVNLAFRRATKPTICYLNDDMVVLPEWDSEIYHFANENNLPDNVWLSSTMIEPTGHNSCCLAPFDYGQSNDQFKEESLLNDLDYLRTRKHNWRGSTWPPMVIHRKYWEQVGGFSEEFNPGFGSDPDLVHKLYNLGFKDFIGVGRSLVYHFGCKTTRVKKFKHNDGEQMFVNKYNQTINNFCDETLHRGSIWTKKS